ncbi:MAG: hypothetical protein GXO25_07770 [Euryarchaeota archaeon]|uniref:Uncharacterized protein n=1 Tax=uncultured euryarchaeote Alv-FOS4 TaxID=337893 RepID=Q3SA57_9EURY|nr:hypothetical protein [uncultured euryarchaeote Alv-FOS4]NPA75957.1 hypothetical protein [Euryarchaeota archaeon]
MYAYRLCDVNYNLKNRKSNVMGGRGSLWLSEGAILIKVNGSWIRLPKAHIVGAAMERKILKIFLRNKVSVEVNSKNDYIIHALYHYIEGAVWKKA